MIRRHAPSSLAFALVVAACGGSTNPGTHQPTIVQVPPSSASSAPAASSKPASVPVNGECKSDDDCVPAECCHPRSCVPVGQRPACKGVMCTMDCRGGTLDCGGGLCLCQAGHCVTEMKKRGG